MKKLPEEELWKGLQSRLGEYKEDPDDETWEKISAAIPHTYPSKGLPWNRIIASTLLLLVAFLTLLIYQYGGQSGQQNKTAEAAESNPAAIGPPELNIGHNTRADKTSGTINDEVEDDAKMISENSSGMNNLTHDTSEIVEANSQSTSAKGTAKHQHIHDYSRNDLALVTPEGTKYLEPKMKSTADGFSVDSPEGHMDNNSPASTNRKNEKVVEATMSNGTNKKEIAKSGILSTEHESGDSKGSTPNSPTEDLGKIEELNTITDKLALKTNSKGSDEITNSDSENSAPNAIQASTFKKGNNSARGKSEAMEDSLSVKTKGVTKEFESIQEDTKNLQVKNRKFYFSITPSLAFVIIKPVPRDAMNVIALHSPGIFNKERLGLSIDAGIQRSLSQRVEWWAGVSFYRQSQRVSYEYEIPAVTISADGSGGYSVSPTRTIVEFNYRMLNAGFSTGLFYKIKGVKLMHKAGIGVQYQQGMLKGSSEMSYNNSKSQYLNYQLSYRIEFPMNEKFNLYLQPTFTHAIVASEKLAEPLSVIPYRAGMALGISFSNLKRNSN